MGEFLDDIDVLLVRGLQADAKESLQRLGERVGLSAPAVLERIRKLEQSGILTGYHALVDARRVGLDVGAFIGVSLNYPTGVASFERWAEAEPQVLECHHVTGGHTLLLKVRARNTLALEQLISAIRGLPGVERTETMLILSTHLERVDLPLQISEYAEPQPRPRRGRRRARAASSKAGSP